jgi:pyridinium-3,5-bisthiocarboxylic acid mononucleotide nickel chelatase
VTGRVAYVNCAAGVAGDMLLGALIDAGAAPTAVTAALDALGLDGYTLSFERTQRGGIAATRAVVSDSGDRHAHRPVGAIRQLLAVAALPDPVRNRANRVFTELAEAEGAVHGVPPDDVELHEVGAVDAIVDVVGVCAALDSLGIDRIVASALAMGHGSVQTAHGRLPNPPPAVARMLARSRVPVVGVDTSMELSTPTGVAILTALAESYGAVPAMTADAAGYGAGLADPPGRPNVVQVLVGTPAAASATPRPGRPAVVLEVNVDDVTGEVLAHTIAALLAAGAHDAWATSIVMKKGRPAHTVAALADPADAERLAALMLAETGSLGLRATTVERWPQRRADTTIELDGQLIRVKVADGRAKPEHDDAVAAARALGRPLREVLREAETRAHTAPVEP